MHWIEVVADKPPVSPWNAVTITTAVIAVLGFLVAAGGLWLSIYNARHQSRRDFPKPRWDIKWYPEQNGSRKMVFTNLGRGTARSVEIWGYAKKPTPHWKMIRPQPDMPYGASGSFIVVGQSEVKIRLQWREEPNLHKVRRKKTVAPAHDSTP